MSRSNPTESNPNPSTRWFEWKGKEGVLSWYDKEAKERKTVKDGFTFLVLDQLHTVTGYNKKAKSGIHANEVRDIQDTLTVKLFDGTPIASGPWAKIKEAVAFKMGSFAKSVYIAFKDGEEFRIGNILMGGCALGPWFDFTKRHGKEVNTQAIVVKRGKQDTSGDVQFYPPVFSAKEVSEETDRKAIELDNELQEFLKAYLSKHGNRPATSYSDEPAQDDPMLEYSEPEKPRGRKQEPDLDEPADESEEPW